MPYFQIEIYGEAPKPWERSFEAEGPTSACALLQVMVTLSAHSQERLLHGVHIGAPYEVSLFKANASTSGVTELKKNREYSSAAEQSPLKR